MAATKFTLLFLVTFIFVQLAWSEPIRQIRDTNAQKVGSDAGKSIDEAVESLKTSFDDILKNIQNNDLMKDIGEGLQKLGETIQTQGKDLVTKIQAASTSNTNKN